MSNNDSTVRILYFSWIREEIGLSYEDFAIQTDCNVQRIITQLKHKSTGHSKALNDTAKIKIAINQQLASDTSKVNPGDEIAFFPPVTGG